jgi:hypothetical protein
MEVQVASVGDAETTRSAGWMARLHPLVFDGEVRGRAKICLRDVFLVVDDMPSFDLKQARAISDNSYALASALIDGTLQEDFIAAMATVGCSKIQLCDLWWSVCIKFGSRVLNPDDPPPVERYKSAIEPAELSPVAPCVVAAFLRAGMPLNSPFQQPLGAPRWGHFSEWPLSTAVRFSAPLSLALLDLPVECGLTLNATDSKGNNSSRAPAIGYTNGNSAVSVRLFDGLLHRTDRSVISDGLVYVDRGADQYYLPHTHVLVSLVLQCAAGLPPLLPHPDVMEMLQVFIAHAQDDGDGTDLTGGTAWREKEWKQVHSMPLDMWPDGEFRGALVLADTGYRHNTQYALNNHITDTHLSWIRKAAARFERARALLLVAMRRIRTYRRSLLAQLSPLLTAGNIGMRDLHAAVVTYVLVPLHNESQLDHPLLTANDTY